MRIIGVIIALTLALAGQTQMAAAQQQPDCTDLSLLEWHEERTDHFAILFPENLRQTIDPLLASRDQMEASYDLMRKLFAQDLDTPITVRIYPDQDVFTCLNVTQAQLLPGQTHTAFGAREISFFADRTSTSPNWGAQAFMDGFRYELAGLFANAASAGQAPPGLVLGVKMYARLPQDVFASGGLANPGFTSPSQTWRYLWENRGVERNQLLQLGATSITAYLVDAYGWPKLVQLLKLLPTSESYRQALKDIYQQELDLLEAQWAEYFPTYFQGRWQAHAIYNYDLSSIELLVEQGAYVDATDAIKVITPFLELTEQTSKVSQSQRLLETARQGEQASNLVNQARQALQRGEYQPSLDLAAQALEIYAAIGDSRRTGEIESYRAHAVKVLDLRSELQQLAGQLPTSRDVPALANSLVDTGVKLGELGDLEGTEIVQQSLDQLSARQEQAEYRRMLILLGLGVLLLGVRIWLVRKPKPVEVL